MGLTARFDLVTLGSGSTAFAAALRVKELRKTALMAEERTIGGTPFNQGCLLSKTAKIIHDTRYPHYPGAGARGIEAQFL